MQVQKRRVIVGFAVFFDSGLEVVGIADKREGVGIIFEDLGAYAIGVEEEDFVWLHVPADEFDFAGADAECAIAGEEDDVALGVEDTGFDIAESYEFGLAVVEDTGEGYDSALAAFEGFVGVEYERIEGDIGLFFEVGFKIFGDFGGFFAMAESVDKADKDMGRLSGEYDGIAAKDFACAGSHAVIALEEVVFKFFG